MPKKNFTVERIIKKVSKSPKISGLLYSSAMGIFSLVHSWFSK